MASDGATGGGPAPTGGQPGTSGSGGAAREGFCWALLPSRTELLMRLVIDGQRLNPARTGVGRCLESLLDDWSKSGWPLGEVLLALRDPAAASQFTGWPSLSIQVVGPRHPALLWEILGLGRLLRKDDLLFAPANLIPPFWRGKSVLIVYDTLPWSAPEGFPWHVRWRFQTRYRLAARRATRVIVPSEATARDVQTVHGLRRENLSVVYPGPEPSFRPLLPDSLEVLEAGRTIGLGDSPFFLFVGKRSSRRNVPAILEAFRSIRGVLPLAKLVFVGPPGGALPTGPESGVIDSGHVSESVLRGLLSSALALLYPSDHEGFGLPVVEAQASGCPVVTLRKSALIESAGEGAYFLESATTESLATAMKRLATEPLTRQALIAGGLENVRRFSAAGFAEGVKRVIQEVART